MIFNFMKLGKTQIKFLESLYEEYKLNPTAFVNPKDAEKALEIMKKDENGRGSVVIGEVIDNKDYGIVTMESLIGANRIVDMLSGEQLPRIC